MRQDGCLRDCKVIHRSAQYKTGGGCRAVQDDAAAYPKNGTPQIQIFSYPIRLSLIHI